jgi:hypothetical protein
MACRSHIHTLKDVCLKNAVHVTEPVVLISQIQRSGGSLLSQLFDCHPEIHAHPHELKIGHPKKYMWPQMNLSDGPKRWFNLLFEESVIRLFEEGYKKEPTSNIAFSFVFLPYIQKKIFYEYFSSLDSIRMRDIFDAYMTSYFGAWLNNHNYLGGKKYVTGFTPRLSEDAGNMETFFTIYPDGRLISLVRNPQNWFPSALRHNQKIKKDKYSDIQTALAQWTTNSAAMIRNKERYQERVWIIKFEDLIQHTEKVMKYLAQALGIKYQRILTEPTFNGMPIKANTSFDSTNGGIIRKTTERHKTLSADEAGIVEKETKEVYEAVLKHAVQF